jgi:hypothetical protein
MFIGNVDLGNGTGLELVIVPLKGTSLQGQWSFSTDLLLVCVSRQVAQDDHHRAMMRPDAAIYPPTKEERYASGRQGYAAGGGSR